MARQTKKGLTDTIAGQMKKRINRRKLIAGLGALSGAAFIPAAPAYAKNKRVLRQVTCWPKNFPGIGMAPENIARYVKQMTDGELEIKTYAAGELVGALEAFDAVSTGTADIYNGAEYYWRGKNPAFVFFTTWPFGMTRNEFSSWIEFGGGQELWDELSARFNIKCFISGDTGTQSGGWFNKEINTLNDLRGLKMRIPGLGGEVLRRHGSIPVLLPGGEIYAGLQSGSIDAAEWVGPWNDIAFGFPQIAKYFYSPGFQEPNAALATGINLDVWNGLPEKHQAILQAACHSEARRMGAIYFHNNARALMELKTRYGITPRTYPQEIMTALRKTAHQVIREEAEKNELAGRIYKSIQTAMTSYRDWLLLAEEGYLKYSRS